DDIYVRYQSFSTQSKLEEAMQKMDPYKIDIGAVYCHWPNQHNTVKSGSFQALEKELVFDIDMTDYNDVRSCCTAADICPKYWTLMTIALCILDRALRGESKEKKGDLIISFSSPYMYCRFVSHTHTHTAFRILTFSRFLR
uniref:DNA primase AEP n=1 Tax=Oncorhynchus mykiss TaxID=8022 RepID=A0A8C7TE58_ONCMY